MPAGKRYLTAPFSASDSATALNMGRFRVAVKINHNSEKERRDTIIPDR